MTPHKAIWAAFRADPDLTYAALALAAGLPYSTVHRVGSEPRYEPSPETARRIIDACSDFVLVAELAAGDAPE